MTASRAQTFAPPNALRLWTDGKSIYVELSGNPVHIISYRLTEQGLSKALELIKIKSEFAGEPQNERTFKFKSASAVLAERILRAQGIIK